MQRPKFFRSVPARIMLLVFAAVYSLFAIGVLKSTHVCMERTASVTFFSSESKKCPCSLFATESNSCCHDDHDLLKIQSDHQAQQAYHLSVPQLYILEDLYTERLIAVLTNDEEKEIPLLQSEPPPGEHLFKLHCSLVFYDSSRA